MIEISQKHLDKLQEQINDELARRLMPPVKLELKKDRHEREFITAKSELFNTVPVLYKSIRIEHFNSSIRQRAATEEVKVDVANVWMTLGSLVELFGGGHNGVEVLEVRATFWEGGVSDVVITSAR